MAIWALSASRVERANRSDSANASSVRFCPVISRAIFPPGPQAETIRPGVGHNLVLLMVWHQKTPLPALEKSYRILEEVHSDNGRKINIVVNGVKDQLISHSNREREVAEAR
jgi:hypothetical protein